MPPRLEKPALLLWALLLFLLCASLNQRHHRFPYYYHPDEPGKVEQILTGRWNFNHPMLLLSATHLAVEALHVPRQEQAIVETGRLVSSLFTAAAVVALSLTAYLWRGWLPAIVGGLALAVHHQLYELSHYMKEDSALLFGLACTFLATVAFGQRPSPWRAFLLGAACALALSGKYLGAVGLAVAVPVLWRGSAGHRLEQALFFATGFLALLVLINFPLVLDVFAPTGISRHSFSREVGLVVHGQGEVTRRVPHSLYWNVFLDNSTPAIWLLLLAFGAGWVRRLAWRPRAETLIAVFPIVLALALSCSPKENDRYFLPATAVFTLLAALGLQDFPTLVCRLCGLFGAQRPERFFAGTRRRLVVLFGGVLLLGLQFTGWSTSKAGWWRYDQAFTRDDIADLVTWMRTELPPHAVVAADSRTGLRDPKRKKQLPDSLLPQKLLVKKMAAELGTLDELRAQKVDYVAVSESSYGRYFRGNLHAKQADDRQYSRAKAFYEELLRTGDPVFERERSTVIYLHPGIRVYRLGPAL